MKRSVLFALTACAGASAVAQTPPPRPANVTLTAPSTFEDGSPITGAITYNVYRGTCGGAKTRVVSGAAATPISVPDSVPGQCFTATAVVEGSESAQSGEARFRGRPGSPTITVIITVEIE